MRRRSRNSDARKCYVSDQGREGEARASILSDTGGHGQCGRSSVSLRVTIAKMAGVEVPADTKVLIGETESVDVSEPFAHEKLSPVLAMYRAADFDDALNKAVQLVQDGGHGPYLRSVCKSQDTEEGREKMAKHQAAMKTCRILVNTPSAQGGIGDLYNFRLTPVADTWLRFLGRKFRFGECRCASSCSTSRPLRKGERICCGCRTPEKVYFKTRLHAGGAG